jgi:diacylglycerol kinase family enzyme
LIRVPLIVNPTAGGGRLLRVLGAATRAAELTGHALEVWETRGPSHAAELASLAAGRGEPLVLAFGGDGTYNEVARGLIGSSTSLGVVPGGTTSVLAYEFGVPRPAPRAVAALLAGEDRAMRVGQSDRGDLVLLMLSAGPDSYVLERLRPSFKRLGGRVGVALQAIVEAVGTNEFQRVRVVTDETMDEAGWVIVGNSRCYAGRHHATPGADPFRGDLEVVAQRNSGRRAAATFLLGIPSGRHLRRPDVVRMRVAAVRLEPAVNEAAVPYQVDGDVVGVLPVEVGIDPRPLMVRIPADT